MLSFQRDKQCKKQQKTPNSRFLVNAQILTFLGKPKYKTVPVFWQSLWPSPWEPGRKAQMQSESKHSGLTIRQLDICQNPPVPASVLFELSHFESTARHGHMASCFSSYKNRQGRATWLSATPKQQQTSTEPAPTVFVEQKLVPWKRSTLLFQEVKAQTTPHTLRCSAPALQSHVQLGGQGLVLLSRQSPALPAAEVAAAE